MTNETLERQIIELVATDRLDIPISSMSGKLKRAKPKLARAVEFKGKTFEGERVYARIDNSDQMKARGIKEGIAKFAEEFPRYGKILDGYIEEQRAMRETHLVFGIYEGCRLTADDYMGVMGSLGFTPAAAQNLYQPIIDASRKISRKRDEERSVMLDSTLA